MRGQNLNGKEFTRFGKILIMCMALIIAISFSAIPAESYAASKTKKMTVYDKVIKSGSVVYCCSTKGISKVNLKTGKVTLLKDVKDYGYSGFNKMKKKGKYLYYVFDTGSAAYMGIYRINLKNGKVEKILQSYEGEPFLDLNDYAISGKKLIASGYDCNDKRLNLVMKLNGKNKKKTTKVKARNKVKKTNKKGYKVVEKGDIYEGETTYCYLKTPSGKKYYLGKAKPQY